MTFTCELFLRPELWNHIRRCSFWRRLIFHTSILALLRLRSQKENSVRLRWPRPTSYLFRNEKERVQTNGLHNSSVRRIITQYYWVRHLPKRLIFSYINFFIGFKEKFNDDMMYHTDLYLWKISFFSCFFAATKKVNKDKDEDKDREHTVDNDRDEWQHWIVNISMCQH